MAGVHDIVWLQTTPSIAAIYYYTYLSKTHALYCPDDNSNIDDITVRRLGRQIVEKFDSSNDKKLAVHFMRPCPVRKLQDVLQFIDKIRKELTIECRVLATTPIQTRLLSGWAMSLDSDFDKHEIWLRRCLEPFHLEAFNHPVEHNKEEWIVTEYLEPFCITDHPFKKRALIINVTRSLCSDKSNVGIVLNEGVEAVIHGWADVVKQLSLPGTVILIADEKKLFKGIPDEQGEMQDKQLQRHRDRTNRYLEQLSTECPVYLYSRDYTGLDTESIADKLACIQHRHSLCLSGSFMINWSREESGLEHELPLKYFSNIHQFYFREILVQKSRVIWKSDFLEILQRKSEKLEPDPLRRISPSSIDLELAGKEKTWTPLLYKSNDKLTCQEAFQGTIRQSVSAFNMQVFQSWKTQMERIREQCNKVSPDLQSQLQSPPPQPQILSFQHEEEEKEEQQQQQQLPSLPLLNEEAIINLRDAFAYRLENRKISKYIDNKNAFSRGGSILGTLDQMKFSGDTESIDIWAKARGTAKEPYNVLMTIVSNTSTNDTEIKEGWCSCPVGKYGKCKHCTALLLRFVINTDEFDFEHSRSLRPVPPGHANEKPRSPSTTRPSQNLSSSATPLRSLSPSPQGKQLLDLITSTDSEPIAIVPDNEEKRVDDMLLLPNDRIPSLEDNSIKPSPKPSSPVLEEKTAPKPKPVARVLPWARPSAVKEEKPTKRRGKKNGDTNTEAKVTPKKRKASKDDNDAGQDGAVLSDPGVLKMTRAKKSTASSSRQRRKKEEYIEEEEEEDDGADLMLIDPKKITTRKRNPRRTTTTKTKTYNESDEDKDALLDLTRFVPPLQPNQTKPSKMDLYPEIYNDHGDDDDPVTIDPTKITKRTTGTTIKPSKSKSSTKSFSDNYTDHDTYNMEEGLDHLALNNENSKYTRLQSRFTNHTATHESDPDDHLHHQSHPERNQPIHVDDNDGSDSDATEDGLGVVYRKSQDDNSAKEGEGSFMSLDQSLDTHSEEASDMEMRHSLDDKETATANEDNMLSLGGIPAITTDDLFDELGL